MNDETAGVAKDVGKEEPSCTVVGMQTGAATLENIMEIHQKKWKWNYLKIQQFH